METIDKLTEFAKMVKDMRNAQVTLKEYSNSHNVPSNMLSDYRDACSTLERRVDNFITNLIK